MLKKEELSMEAVDIQKLRKQLLPTLIFPVFAAGLFTLIYRFVLDDMSNTSGDNVFLYAFIGFGLLFITVMVYMIWSLVTDLNRGIKYRFEGIITDKRLDIQTNRNHTSNSNSKTRTTRNYYVYLDHEEFKMSYQDYTRVKVDDYVIMEKAPKSGVTLSIEIVETGEIQNTIDVRSDDQEYLDTELKEVRFNEKDREALKRVFNAELRRKIIWMIPFLFVIVSLLSNGYWGILMVLFPIIVIPLVQSFRLIMRVRIYFKDKAYDHKQGVTAIVQDKLTTTSNRYNNKNTLKTTWGGINVSSLLYDKIQTGDKVIVFKPKQHKKAMSILTEESEEYYLV